ncbi:MAG: hypothetical protein IJN87_10580 [Firmicutes bacterium]|nr:hypothetical protein [Bacillota bacterium]
MIDLHSHILPGLDDGSSSLEESLQMARLAVESGIKAVVATPHCTYDRTAEVRSAVRLMRKALEEFEIPLRLYAGMEIFGIEETTALLQKGQLITLNHSRYPLIEFDFESDGEEETYILQSVVRAGYRPVVAHPERYRYVQHDPELINQWHEMGCLFQINRGSLLGRFGRGAQNMAMELIGRGFAAAVSSDAHGAGMRTQWMKDVKKLIIEEFSREAAEVLLHRNPGKILKNEEIPLIRPEWFE